MQKTAPFGEVKDVLVEILGLQHRVDTLTPETELLGSLPELDSLAVVELIAALEARFGLELDDADLTGEAFETLGSLTEFISAQRP